MNYESIIHAFVDTIIENKDMLMVREMPSESDNEVVLLVVATKADTARLIGRQGKIANSLREVLNLSGIKEGKRIRIKFESYEEDEI